MPSFLPRRRCPACGHRTIKTDQVLLTADDKPLGCMACRRDFYPRPFPLLTLIDYLFLHIGWPIGAYLILFAGINTALLVGGEWRIAMLFTAGVYVIFFLLSFFWPLEEADKDVGDGEVDDDEAATREPRRQRFPALQTPPDNHPAKSLRDSSGT